MEIRLILNQISTCKFHNLSNSGIWKVKTLERIEKYADKTKKAPFSRVCEAIRLSILDITS